MERSIGLMLRRGAVAACPLCGGRGIFHRIVRMEARCPTCGLVFERTEGHWLGSWFLNICVSQMLVAVALFTGFVLTYPELRIVPAAAVAAASALVVPVAFFPTSRMLWTAIDLAMRPLDFDDGVAPGWVLERLDRRP